MTRRRSAAQLSVLPTDTQTIMDAYAVSAAVLDRDGVILAVSNAWRDYGTSNGLERDLVGESYLRVCDEARGLWGAEAAAAAAGIRAVAIGRLSVFTLEYPCHNPQQERYFAMRATPCATDWGAKVLVAHEEVTGRRQYEAALREAYHKIVCVREEERQRIARDLHDGVGQRIFGLELGLENLLAKGCREEEVVAQLQKAVHHTREILCEVRQLAQRLFPQALEMLALPAALERLAGDAALNGLVRFSCSPELAAKGVRLDRDQEIALYRIAQEATANALAHGRPEHVEISLARKGSELLLAIVDDGVGFDIDKPGMRGMGIASMRERSQAIGAQLDIYSRPGKTRVVARLPNPT